MGNAGVAAQRGRRNLVDALDPDHLLDDIGPADDVATP
jgi:hypothetical protein